MKQVDLINLISSNPYDIKVFFLEVGELNANDYIFIDKIMSKNIYADGKVVLVQTTILITVYSTNNKILQETMSFLKNKFNGETIYGKEEIYYKAMLTTNVMVDEWV